MSEDLPNPFGDNFEDKSPFGGSDFNAPNPYSELEVPNERVAPRPLISWGIVMATIVALVNNVKTDRNFIGIDSINIGIDDGDIMSSLPGVIIDLKSIKTMRFGFNSIDFTDPRNMVLRSTGELKLDIIARTVTEMWTLRDYITQLYLMHELQEEPFFFPGMGRSYIGLNYQPGTMSWTSPSKQENHEAGRDEDHIVSTTNIGFEANHKFEYDLKRITDIDINAIPTSFEL